MSYDSEISVTKPVEGHRAAVLAEMVVTELAAGRSNIRVIHETDPRRAYLKNREYRTLPRQGLLAEMVLAYNPSGEILADPGNELGHKSSGTHLLIWLSSGGDNAEEVHRILIGRIGAGLTIRKLPWQWRTPMGDNRWHRGH